MKILYILHSSKMEGSTISFLNMLRGMREKGVEAVVAVPTIDEGFSALLAEMGGRCVKSTVVFTTYTPVENKAKQLYDFAMLAVLPSDYFKSVVLPLCYCMATTFMCVYLSFRVSFGDNYAELLRGALSLVVVIILSFFIGLNRNERHLLINFVNNIVRH